MTERQAGERPAASCPLCGSGRVETIDQFAFRDLRHLYFEACEIDIAECVGQPYDRDLVDLSRCGACGLEFYPEALVGTEKLYEGLAKWDYYYMHDKWEFELAAVDVKEAEGVLEIGCGPGLFLARLREMYPAKKAKGLELNEAAVRTCRGKGLDVEARTVEEFARDHEGDFDAVCAFQVLEHVAAPGRFLEAAFKCLRPGGLCIVSVPNARGFTGYAVNDFGNMPPHHLSRWTADVMRTVAARQAATLERLVEEPVAEYHKDWYRDTLTVRALSKVLGLRWGRIERRLPYRLLLSVSRRLQRASPAWLWRYRHHAGHTLYASFRKLGSAPRPEAGC